MPQQHFQKNKPEKEDNETICLFAQTNFRGRVRRFGIKTDDRRRHMYVIGKTGMGKTTMLENMVLQDIYKGHGVGIVDPHGDFAEKVIDYIPANRINDVVYINPSDTENPIGFNILEVHSDEQKHLVASGLMATFKKIWPDVWSSRMEYILNNTLLALLDYPGSTLLGINRLLGDKKYRKRVVNKLKDPVIKSFWTNEFANYPERYMTEAVAPIQNKIGQFLSANVIRNMVAQVKSTIDIREAMDSKKILIMNLSKGRVGEDNSRLLGGMLITKIQLSAMERVDTPEEQREDFFLYVDEFQNFATPSFANILSEARKYRLSLIMAHQYVMQLDEVVADAVFGNVGTIITFRVGGADAEMLTKEFEPVFVETDIVNLSKYCILLKLMIDGVASHPFSSQTMPPIGSPTGSREKVIRVSRERYGRPRDQIEEKIRRWSGIDGDVSEEDMAREEAEDARVALSRDVKPAPASEESAPENVSKKDDEEIEAPPIESVVVKQKTPVVETQTPKVQEKKKVIQEKPNKRVAEEKVDRPKHFVEKKASSKTVSLKELLPKKVISRKDETKNPGILVGSTQSTEVGVTKVNASDDKGVEQGMSPQPQKEVNFSSTKNTHASEKHLPDRSDKIREDSNIEQKTKDVAGASGSESKSQKRRKRRRRKKSSEHGSPAGSSKQSVEPLRSMEKKRNEQKTDEQRISTLVGTSSASTATIDEQRATNNNWSTGGQNQNTKQKQQAKAIDNTHASSDKKEAVEFVERRDETKLVEPKMQSPTPTPTSTKSPTSIAQDEIIKFDDVDVGPKKYDDDDVDYKRDQ